MKAYFIAVLFISNIFAGSGLLSNNRQKLTFNPLSLDEKEILIKQSNVLFKEIYVNLANKKNIYQFNPEMEFENILEKFSSMSELEFHQNMLNAYNHSKDYHVNYYLPKPYSCYSLRLPISIFANKNDRYLITAVSLEDQQLAPVLKDIEIGSEVLSYQGKKIKTVMLEKENLMNASTSSSRKRFAEYDLFWKDLASDIAPIENNVELVVKNLKGEKQVIRIPWLIDSNEECLNYKNEEAEKNKGSGLVLEKNRMDFISKSEKSFERNWSKIKNHLKKFFNFNDNYVDLSDVIKTEDDSVRWKVFEINGEKIGYLKLTTFRTETPVSSTKKIKRIIEEYFSETKALIIDVRSNYGGQIDFAEYVASLFYAKKPEQFPFKIRANSSTLELFFAGDPWYNIIADNQGKNVLVGPGFISDIGDFNYISQSYFGKVAVFTNAECFSSCEIFTAAMKDYANVPVFGVHDSTFGGGANVWSVEYFCEVFVKNGLPCETPQKMEMRATVRNGHRPSDLSIIDDVGIKTDFIIPIENSEMINLKQSRMVYQIAKQLVSNRILKSSKDYQYEIITELKKLVSSNEIIGNYQSNEVDEIVIFKGKKEMFKAKKNNQNSFMISFVDPDFKTETFYTIYGYKKGLIGKKLINRRSVKII